MASIVKRKSKYSVVYTYTDDNGDKKQKWETFDSMAAAKKRKTQIEFEQDNNTFIVPTAKTLDDLMEEYMSIYGVNTWAMSTYDSNKSLYYNYIKPMIGDLKLSDITTRTMNKFYQDLLKVKAISTHNRKAKTEYVTPSRVKEAHKLLHSAFNQALKWELISKNPTENAIVPKAEHKPREIWDVPTLRKALDACDDEILYLAINLAFSCCLRMGEMLALTWDCINISSESINNGTAYIFIDKELQRANRDALNKLSDKDVIFKFPPALKCTNTALILKKPKTKTSVRKVFLPKTVANLLQQRYNEIQELKELFGDEYIDYNLVFASTCGRPIEGQVINRAFQKLIDDNKLPDVVFHSLRHSSVTYKLKLNGGDIKSVQGDSGHAQAKMVTDTYSHILDDDRCINAQRMENAFYNNSEDKMQSNQSSENSEDTELIKKILANPQMMALIKGIADTI